MKLAILRHGPTLWNVQGRIQGHTDIPLSDEGVTKMRGLMPPTPFEGARVFVSTSRRARQTAEALGLIDATWDPRLMEQNWGDWEGLSTKAILERDGADAFERAGQALAFRPPGGESTAELHDRVAAFLKDIARDDRDAIAVAHFGVLRAAYTMATGWDMATPMPPELDVSKALILELTSDGVPGIHALNVELRPRTA
ncbi:MAG: histidine phosphatase family protein [Pseudomonadota bacterium]